jgi:hypothetical protein
MVVQDLLIMDHKSKKMFLPGWQSLTKHWCGSIGI